jgi:hypothetical protein
LKNEAAAIAAVIVDEGLLQCKTRPAEKVGDAGSTNVGGSAGLCSGQMLAEANLPKRAWTIMVNDRRRHPEMAPVASVIGDATRP